MIMRSDLDIRIRDILESILKDLGNTNQIKFKRLNRRSRNLYVSLKVANHVLCIPIFTKDDNVEIVEILNTTFPLHRTVGYNRKVVYLDRIRAYWMTGNSKYIYLYGNTKTNLELGSLEVYIRNWILKRLK